MLWNLDEIQYPAKGDKCYEEPVPFIISFRLKETESYEVDKDVGSRQLYFNHEVILSDGRVGRVSNITSAKF